MDVEIFLHALGYIFLSVSATFLLVRRRDAASSLVVAGVLLVTQAWFVAVFFRAVPYESFTSEADYYAHIPIWFKTSIHAGQAGLYVAAVGLALVALSLRKRS